MADSTGGLRLVPCIQRRLEASAHLDIDDLAPRTSDDDPLFERTCLRYGLPVGKGQYLSATELSKWSPQDLSTTFDKIHDLPINSDTVRRPYFWQAQHWVKPPNYLVERAADEKLALCINKWGDWQLLETGYVAMSHVWDEGLYADARNRGLPRCVIEQLFVMLQPVNARWLWLDSLAVPGGRRELTLKEEFVKVEIINNMDVIYRNADMVVILDALLLRLQSRDPIDVAVTLLFGRWTSRVWTFQEAKLTSRALILTKAGFVDLRELMQQLQEKNNCDRGKVLQLYESLDRLLGSRNSPPSIVDIAISSSNRETHHEIDYSRGLFACLGLKWDEKFTRDRGMQCIMELYKKEAPQLLGFHGSPLLVDGYGWAPAYFRGLTGTPVPDITWEEKGVRNVWYFHAVISDQEKQLLKPSNSTLLLEIEGLEGIALCGCALAALEHSEAVEGFKMAIKHQKAFLLSRTEDDTKSAVSMAVKAYL